MVTRPLAGTRSCDRGHAGIAPGTARFGLRVKSPVIISYASSTTTRRRDPGGSPSRGSLFEAPGDHEIAADDQVGAGRSRSGSRGSPRAFFASRMWQATRRPSARGRSCRWMPKPLPSRWAAMAEHLAEMVTTPVPPTPVTIDRSRAWSSAGQRRLGHGLQACAATLRLRAWSPLALAQLSAVDRDEARAEALRRRRSPCCRPTGRSRACVPSSVSSGTTATQFDFLPQSPQPSQTASLMNTRLSGSGNIGLALAPAALLGGAGLVVDQHRRAGDQAADPSAPGRASRRCMDASRSAGKAAALRIFAPARR